jgi:hypothetical protein
MCLICDSFLLTEVYVAGVFGIIVVAYLTTCTLLVEALLSGILWWLWLLKLSSAY